MNVTAAAEIPAGVSPLSFVLGILAFVALVAVLGAIYGAVQFFRAGGHRAGVARLARYDEATETPEARRRARLARRTVMDAATGTVTVEPRRTR